MQFRMLVPFTFLQLEQFRATFHQLVHDAGLRLVLLAGLHLACEIGYGVERASAGHADGLRHDSPGHVIDQGDQSGQQAAFSLVPESVAGVLSRLRAVRVVHDVRDQSHDRHVRLVRIDIVERVETRVRRQIHQIELAHVVAFPFERFMGPVVQLALRVGARVAHVCVEDVRNDVRGGLAGTRRADHQGVEVAPRGRRVDAQSLGRGHLEVLVRIRIRVGGHLVGFGPTRRTVFLAVSPVSLAHAPLVQPEQSHREHASQHP